MYIETNKLPCSIKGALKSTGYRRSNIRVSQAETYSLSGVVDNGRRAFVIAVNLETGETKYTYGSWGGANMYNPDNAVDMDSSNKPLPTGFAIIKGTEGNSIYASVIVHPSNIAKMIPAKLDATKAEIAALGIIDSIVSAYRKDVFSRKKLGVYSTDNPLIQTLAERGLIKINKAGSIRITTAGKNAAMGVV